jgi:hypothetical protein
LGDIQLKKAVLFNQTAAGNGTAYPLDYINDGTQNRTLQTVSAAADTIDIQATVDGGVTWFSVLAATHTTAGTFYDKIAGPFEMLRVVKTGALGNSLVQGIL